MNTLHIYARLTHGYTLGYAYLDRHVHVADLKLTPRKTLADDGEDRVAIAHGRLSAKQRAQALAVWKVEGHGTPFKTWLARAISDTHANGCRCEHDCCGHWQSYASTLIVGRKVVVRIRSYRNL